MPTNLLLIALGGAIGSVLRYAVGGMIQAIDSAGSGAVASTTHVAATSPTFPYGTLGVNILGCLAIGLLAGLVAGDGAAGREPWRLFLIVGVLGGFTTFSAFGLDAITLAQAGRWGQAVAYVLSTNLACLGAVWLAMAALGGSPDAP